MSTERSFNFTNASTVFNGSRNEDLARAEVAVECAILFLAVFGNSIVVISIFQKRKKMTRMQLLILHLSTADFFVAFFSVLPQLMWDIYYPFRGDDALCRIVTYLQVVAIYASSYVLVTTAIDRYIAICYPFLSHKLSSRKVHMMVIVAWTLSLLFSIPQMFVFGYREVSPDSYDCYAMFVPEWTEKLYVTCFTVCVYILPTIILSFCYSRICFTVWRSGKVGEQVRSSHKQVNGHESDSSNSNPRLSVGDGHCTKHHGISRAKLRTIKLTMTVVLCYFVCWTPFFVTQLHSVYDRSAPWTSKYNKPQ